jgi:hypothetical protein
MPGPPASCFSFNALQSALTSTVGTRTTEVEAGLALVFKVGLVAITNEPFDSQACGIGYITDHRYGNCVKIFGYLRTCSVEKLSVPR